MGAALLPEGQEFLLRQTRLLGLHFWRSTFGIPGRASDGLLQVIGRLKHLTRLDCHFSDQHRLLSNPEPPSLLGPAMDEGVRCLSSLQSLQDLRLTVNIYHYAVTGQALSTIGSLHHCVVHSHYVTVTLRTVTVTKSRSIQHNP